MSDTQHTCTTSPDELAMAAFLDLLATDLCESSLLEELPTEVIAFARTRDLSDIDVTEIIADAVDI